MKSTQSLGRQSGPGPRSRIGSRTILACVILAIACLVAWTALPIVRPTRTVDVVQAVFVRSTPSATPADPVASVPVRPTVQAPGWLEAEPYFIACTALADGIVDSIDVLEGDFVEQGDIVARLVAADSEIRLEVADAELANARAALRVAEAERHAAAVLWDEPVELERAVASGNAAVAENEAELAQLPSLIEAADATLLQLDEEFSRIGRSYESGAATDLEVIIARQRATAQRAEVAALHARKPLLEARGQRLRADLRAAERNLELRIEDRRRLDASEAAVLSAAAAVSRAEASRAEAALELARMTIRAPISGYVQRRLKVPGDKVIRMMDSPHSAHLVHLYDPEQLRVRVDVPLADASHILVGQECEVVVEVLPDRVFRGTVVRATHEADLQKNTLEIQVQVHDPDPLLRPEMLTRVKFVGSSETESGAAHLEQEAGAEVLIPRRALQQDGESATVWVVRERRNGQGSLVSLPVEVTASAEKGWVRVRSSLQPGDLIAIGLDQPRAGERVTFTSHSDPEQEGSS